jgi:hypothetical protein
MPPHRVHARTNQELCHTPLSDLKANHPCIATTTHRTDRCRTTGTVLVFRQGFALEDVIGSHTCSLEANLRVTKRIPLGCQLPLTVATINCVET